MAVARAVLSWSASMSRSTVTILIALGACGGTSARPDVDAGPTADSDAAEVCGGTAEAAAVMATAKVCQLTGDVDRELGAPTLNQTGTRYDVGGTDLGVAFEHEGKMVVLFGDTIPVSNTPWNSDSIATSNDTDPDDCVALEFLTDASGNFLRAVVPGIDLEAFHVPLDGVSAGSSIYAWFSTGPLNVMDRSILARSDDGAASWSYLRDESTRHFINVSADVVEPGQVDGLPSQDGPQVLAFGSGAYRGSDLYLAVTPLVTIEEAATTRYFAGADADGCNPRWSEDEAEAIAIIDTLPLADPGGCVGELSVHYSEPLARWVAMYNCGDPRGIQLHVAKNPWGPWSAGATAFDPADGYCKFMHTNWQVENCDAVHDPGRENEWGGEYGPYIMERYSRDHGDHVSLYYIMSTWNPYNTVVMRTDIAK